MTVPDPSIRTTGVMGPPAVVSPQAGMQYPLQTAADPTGKITTGCALLLYLPSAARAVPSAPYFQFSTEYITNCSFDVNITAFTGGTSPTITFIFERLGGDGNWYPILPPSGSGVVTLAAAVTASVDIGLLPQSLTGGGISAVYGSAHNVFTPMSRVRWTFGGTAQPTSVTFSLSLYGR